MPSLKEFVDKVYEAFNKHCEEVHEETIKKLRETAEDDADGRKKILEEQKAELDKTVAELKQVLNEKARDARGKMEELEQKKLEKEFDLDKQLQTI